MHGETHSNPTCRTEQHVNKKILEAFPIDFNTANPTVWHQRKYGWHNDPSLIFLFLGSSPDPPSDQKWLVLDEKTRWWLSDYQARGFKMVVHKPTGDVTLSLHVYIVLFLCWSSFHSQRRTILNFPTRHGVPRGSDRRAGARPAGQRWRKWSHHHLLLIGRTEKAIKRQPITQKWSEGRLEGRTLWALGDMGP